MKSNKPLWRIAVKTSLEAEDAVAELLGKMFGASVVAYFDLDTSVSTVAVFQNKVPSAKKYRDKIAAMLRHIEQCGLKVGDGSVEISRVKREDWAESWKRHFPPLEIGPHLLVKPSWSKFRRKKNQAVVILDPGLSFGTGQHPTTSFCLGQIVETVKRRPEKISFLDIGTGSGILAIAASKLGCMPVRAFDFDPESVRVAKANAKKNRVENRCHISRGDITRAPVKSTRKYDLICANLISNLLIAERRRIVSRLAPGGTLVLAGILAEEFGKVQKAFENLGLIVTSKRSENEWCSGAFCFG